MPTLPVRPEGKFTTLGHDINHCSSKSKLRFLSLLQHPGSYIQTSQHLCYLWKLNPLTGDSLWSDAKLSNCWANQDIGLLVNLYEDSIPPSDRPLAVSRMVGRFCWHWANVGYWSHHHQIVDNVGPRSDWRMCRCWASIGPTSECYLGSRENAFIFVTIWFWLLKPPTFCVFLWYIRLRV